MNATTPITTGLASQGGHWYAADGSPAYEIPAKSGALRAVTLRDARKLNLFPSVTTIQACAAKPGLERWKIEQAIHAALTLPRIEGETETEYAVRVLEDSKEQARKAAALGTLLHEQIERSFSGSCCCIACCACDPEWWEYVKPVRDWLAQQFGDVEWNAERSFVHPRGYGGKVDLHSRHVVIDFKTKGFDNADDVKAYDEHGVQLAAYQVGLGLERNGEQYPERWNVFVSTTTPGLIKPVLWSPDTFDRHWTMFCCLLDFWQADKGYKPERAA